MNWYFAQMFSGTLAVGNHHIMARPQLAGVCICQRLVLPLRHGRLVSSKTCTRYMIGSKTYIIATRQHRYAVLIYKYSSGIGIRVALSAAHIAGCSSGRAIISVILTSKHCSHQHKIDYLEAGRTDIVLYITRSRIFRFKVHDAHLVDLRLERYRDIHTQLPRRLDMHASENGMREVVLFSWYPLPGIQSRYKISRMAREGEKTAGIPRISLRIVHYLACSVSDYICWTGDGD